MPFAHLESTIQDIHKMTIVQKESMRPAKQGIKKGKVCIHWLLYFQMYVFCRCCCCCSCCFLVSKSFLVVMLLLLLAFFLFSLLIPTVSFSYKNLPFVIREAAVLIMYLVDVHIFTAVTTVCWIIWSVCVCAFMRQMCRIFSLSSPHFFSSVFRFFFIGIGFFLSLSVCVSLSRSSPKLFFAAYFSHFVLFTPFIYVVLIKPLWRLPPHSAVLTTMWIYRIYKQSFSSCFTLSYHYLLSVLLKRHVLAWLLVLLILRLYVCK